MRSSSITFVRRIILLLVAASALQSAPVQADEASPETTSSRGRVTLARERFERARQAFARNDFAAAATAFEESAGHVLHPAPLVNAADAWTRAGDLVRAARACDRALAIEDIDQRTRAMAEEQLANALRRVGTLEAEGRAGLLVRVDGSEGGAVPLRMRLAPGPHLVEAIDPSGNVTQRMTVVLDPGRTTTRAIQDPTVSPRPAQERAEPVASGGPPLLTYASYGVAIVGFGTGAYFGASTLDARERWAEAGTDDARSDFYRDRALTNVALGIGLVGVVVGTIVWLSHRHDTALKTSAWFGPTALDASVRARR